MDRMGIFDRFTKKNVQREGVNCPYCGAHQEGSEHWGFLNRPKFEGSIRGTTVTVVKSVIRMYFYACASFLVGFVLPFFFEPLKVIGSSILSAIMPELSLFLGTLAHGSIVATLSLFAWNFLVGSCLQIFAGLFGADTPQIVLVGRAGAIGLIYGATYDSILHTLRYDIVNFAILIVVVSTEFLAHAIATHGGVQIGKSIGKLDDGTIRQRIVNFLIGPLPFTYRRVKHKLKRQMKSAVRLCPIIAAILMFSAMLEIWLIMG